MFSDSSQKYGTIKSFRSQKRRDLEQCSKFIQSFTVVESCRIFSTNGLVLSEVVLYIERSKNLEKKNVITVQKMHLP